MGKTRAAYPAEYREQIVALARGGQSVASLAREFEPHAQTIRHWIRQARQEEEGPAAQELALSAEQELARLRRENQQLRLEREILSKAAAWFARETAQVPPRSTPS